MTYLPKIQEITEGIIATLVDDNYFIDFEISSQDYARKRISDELTIKFLENGLNNEEDGYLSEDEFDIILKEIVAEDLLRTLQKKGLLNSYEDDNTEEVFFLTTLGKEEIVNLEDIEDVKALRVFLDNEEEK
jgi:hypothetical protein